MIKTLLYPFKRFAWFKRLNAKVTYELLAKHIPAEDWHFMNYGYSPNPTEAALILDQTLPVADVSLSGRQNHA